MSKIKIYFQKIQINARWKWRWKMLVLKLCRILSGKRVRENDKSRKSNGSRSKKKLINVKLCCFGRRWWANQCIFDSGRYILSMFILSFFLSFSLSLFSFCLFEYAYVSTYVYIYIYLSVCVIQHIARSC